MKSLSIYLFSALMILGCGKVKLDATPSGNSGAAVANSSALNISSHNVGTLGDFARIINKMGPESVYYGGGYGFDGPIHTYNLNRSCYQNFTLNSSSNPIVDEHEFLNIIKFTTFKSTFKNDFNYGVSREVTRESRLGSYRSEINGIMGHATKYLVYNSSQIEFESNSGNWYLIDLTKPLWSNPTRIMSSDRTGGQILSNCY